MLTIDEHVELVRQIIRENPALDQSLPFPEFRELLETVLADRAPAINSLPWLMLPIFACEALGGDVSRAHSVAAALEIGRIAAGCLDEWQDQDTDDALWRTMGPARTVNLASGMIPLSFLALSRLSDLGTEPSLVLSLHEEFHRTLLHMSAGQDADLAADMTLDDHELVAGAKSGSLFLLGCRAGAMVADAPADVIAQYGEFGHNLGIVAQLWNDLEGMSGLQGKGDAEQQRSLPVLATQAADAWQPTSPPEQGQVGALYSLVRLQIYHQRATKALAHCPAAGRLGLFLDVYSTRRLAEKTRQAEPHQGESNAD